MPRSPLMPLRNFFQDKADRFESISLCRATVDRAYGKYGIVLIQKSLDKLRREDGDGADELSVENLELESDFEHLHETGDDFPTLEVEPELLEIPDKLAQDFEQARAIFLPAQR